MKKIIGAAAAGLVLTGAAFAEYSVTGNVRFESDVFTYTSPSRSTRPDNGDVNWAKDTKHGDDITLQASGDEVGAKIVLGITSNTNGSANGGVALTSYQGWVNDLFGLRLDAGAYDQRLNKNLSNEGNWQKNLSASYKTGIIANIDGAAWGQDAGNITGIKAAKRTTNFQVSKFGLLDGALTVRGVLFLNTAGTDANGDDANNDNWIFTPFALGAQYNLDKNTQFSFVAKLNSITKSNTTKKTLLAVGAATPAVSVDNGLINPTPDDPSSGVTANPNPALTYNYTTPDNSVWTLNADFYKKFDSGLELQAAYTLGMSLYSNWSGTGAHWKHFKDYVWFGLDDVSSAINKANYSEYFYGDAAEGRLARDADIFAHGFDFRVKNKLSSAFSMTAIANVSYIQGTAIQKATNRRYSTTEDGFKDARAKSYWTGAAGQLAYYATLSLDYAQSDTVTFQVQTKIEDSNLFSTVEIHDKTHVDYLDGLSWTVRPGVIVSLDKSSVFFAGVNVVLDGFHQNATGKNNTFKTTTSIPVGLRVKL